MKKSYNKSRSLSRKSKREFIGMLKTDLGCEDCGYDQHPDALGFDHLPEHEKEYDVSRLISWDKDIEVILNEIAKTEVVCHNCHAIRTARRRNGSSDTSQTFQRECNVREEGEDNL